MILVLNIAQAQTGSIESNPKNEQQEKTIPVTWETFVRAETHRMFKNYAAIGGFGKFFHLQAVTPIDKQDVIRMNRDTRYSIGIFDLTNPLTVTLPDTKGRFISMQVLNEDEYTKAVYYKAGDYTFTKENIGSRYVCLIIRVLVNGEDKADNQMVSEIQNQINAKQLSPGAFEIPNWDKASLDKLRDAINVLASTITDTKLCFGDKDEVDPIAHLLGAAYGWGGSPQKDAMYINVVPEQNDGKTSYQLTVKDVPVDGFWSVSVYNKSGYFELNSYNSYTVNNTRAVKNADGTITIHFGGNPEQSNFIPITEGWNYTVRLYRARKEILDGSWTFPNPIKVN
ncbi:MAG TPA: DUF1214 domain-containing protein [Prolixibacteraceae bacterium]|nr:DUF1214 domain-containing protein [Prolixibacteraceae bacterium]